MKQLYSRPFFGVILIIGLLAINVPQTVRAAGPWYVASTGDDGNDCLSPATPCGTINGAIGKAAGEDTIFVAEGTYTASGTEVVLIDKSINLVGGWNESFTTQSGISIIDGSNLRKGIHVNPGIIAIVERFTVQNGSATQGSGVTLVGGGIYNSGTLTLNNSIVSANTANYGGGISNGGGISTLTGTLTINDSMIIGNSSGDGGGIYNTGILTINNSTVSANTADSGGGIHNSCCNPFFIQILILNNSTISNNTANRGGGIINGGTAIVNNSTVSNNSATSNGGGIDSDYGGTLILNNSSVVGNYAGIGGGVTNYSNLAMQNSILANNIAIVGPECSGTINSSDHNIIGNTNGCTVSPGTGNMFNTNPLLGPLENNGGPTFTHALLASSPAIDSGNPAGCTGQDGNLLTTDQRGIARPQGAACDIGAYEFEPVMIDVSIDIKPGSDNNPINPKSKGMIPVAILSTPDFDAPSMVDTTSLTFGKTGDEASLVSCNEDSEDVNSDGLFDLVCHFDNQLTLLNIPGLGSGHLSGLTVDGIPIEGHDNVTVLD